METLYPVAKIEALVFGEVCLCAILAVVPQIESVYQTETVHKSSFIQPYPFGPSLLCQMEILSLVAAMD